MTPPREVKRYYALVEEIHEHGPFCGNRCTPLVHGDDYDALSALVSQLRARIAELEQSRAWDEPQIVQHGADVMRIEELERDAARYRWLREQGLCLTNNMGVEPVTLEDDLIDRAIDDAIAAATADEKKGEG